MKMIALGSISSDHITSLTITDLQLVRWEWKLPNELPLKRLEGTEVHDCISSLRSERIEQRATEVLKLIIVPRKKFSDTFQNSDSSQGSILTSLERYEWVTGDYPQIYGSINGGSSIFSVEGRLGFIVQTPDDNEPFCSLSLLELKDSHAVAAVCVYDNGYDINGLLANHQFEKELEHFPGFGRENETPFRRCSQAFMSLGVKILRNDGNLMRTKLANLMHDLAEKEARIVDEAIEIVPSVENRALNEIRLQHLKIHRRWAFECELGEHTEKYYSGVCKQVSEVFHESQQWAAYYLPFMAKLKIRSQEQVRFAERLRYDIEMVPQRIDSLSRMIFNVVQLRDNKANLEIAQSSQQLTRVSLIISQTSALIADDARRDSSSMETIAALTLVFLPGTFTATFFSMTMFNWQPPPDQIMTGYIWVYFVVTGGITILVVVVWRVWHRKTRVKQREQLEAIDAALKDGEKALNLQQFSSTPTHFLGR